MGILDWLTRKPTPAAHVDSTSLLLATEPAAEPTEQEIFQSPQLLAAWVSRFVIEAISIEQDYKLLPDEQARRNLKITLDQVERCAREYSLLRATGVCFWVKQAYTNDFYLLFLKHVARHLLDHAGNHAGEAMETPSEVANAIDAYIDALSAKDVDRCALTYLRRVYDDSEKFYTLLQSGIGFIAQDFIETSYVAFRDAYCKVTRGLSFEELKK